MKKTLVEVCCGSADDVIEAYRAGADRVELNSDLFHGGLTPTLGSLLVAKRETGMKIMTMVRPREGGFCYTGTEFAAALEDAGCPRCSIEARCFDFPSEVQMSGALLKSL